MPGEGWRTQADNSKRSSGRGGPPAELSRTTRRLPEGPWDPTKIPRIQILMSQDVCLVGVGVVPFPQVERQSDELDESVDSSRTDRIGLITRRSEVQILPPPPTNRWSVRLVPRAQEPDQWLRVRASVQRRCSQGFYRTYSPVPNMSPPVLPTRCLTTRRAPTDVALRRPNLVLDHRQAIRTRQSWPRGDSANPGSTDTIWSSGAISAFRLPGGSTRPATRAATAKTKAHHTKAVV